MAAALRAGVPPRPARTRRAPTYSRTEMRRRGSGDCLALGVREACAGGLARLARPPCGQPPRRADCRDRRRVRPGAFRPRVRRPDEMPARVLSNAVTM